MPEIGEVARVVHFLRKYLVGRKIASCTTHHDDIVYGKVGCSAAAFESAVVNRTVTGADQQGKYFYMTFDRPPHAVMHLGMTGWVKFDAEDTYYYKKGKEKDAKEEEWPPKYAKFILRAEKEKVDGVDRPAVECAFVDARRLARIRLVDCDAAKIRDVTPLKENGPDPVRDKDKVTVEWLKALLQKKKVPVKALLLDQGNLSGVGNWVADEVLYQACIHPEQYSNTFSDRQIQQLHKSLLEVTGIAVATLGDSSQFPQDWLMKYRWDKGKKDANVLPNGEKIMHLKVGGRTSAIVLSRQKKTGAVAGDVNGADDVHGDGDEEVDSKITKATSRKRKVDAEDTVDEVKSAKKGRGKAAATEAVKAETATDEVKTPLKAGATKGTKSRDPPATESPGSRRSARTRAK